MAKEKKEIKHTTLAGESGQLNKIKELSIAAGKSLSRFMIESTLAYAERGSVSEEDETAETINWHFTVENGKRIWYADTLPYHICLNRENMAFDVFCETDDKKIAVTQKLSLAKKIVELITEVSPIPREPDTADADSDD